MVWVKMITLAGSFAGLGFSYKIDPVLGNKTAPKQSIYSLSHVKATVECNVGLQTLWQSCVNGYIQHASKCVQCKPYLP